MGKNSHSIHPEEVRKLGLIEYLKKYKSKMSKKQLYEIGTRYMNENYMRNGNTHAVITNAVMKYYEKDKSDK